MAGQVLGTPYYMSPEQWGEISRDGNPEIDGRTDIYSLGLVAYQMISGQRAYSAATLHELRREHISVIPPPLSEKIPDVPHAFSDAIDRAISKDRNDRQSTAGEFSAQLQAGLGDTGQGQQARPYADIPRGGSPQANTQGAPGGIDTKSDVNAATILTVDAVPTSAPNVPRPIVPVTPEQPAQSSNAADLSSSVTIQQQPRPAVDQGKPRVLVDLDAPKKSRGKPLVFVGAGVLILILASCGGGWIFCTQMAEDRTDRSAQPPPQARLEREPRRKRPLRNSDSIGLRCRQTRWRNQSELPAAFRSRPVKILSFTLNSEMPVISISSGPAKEIN